MSTTKVIYRSYSKLTSRAQGSPDYEKYTTEKAKHFTGIGVQKDQTFEMFKATQKAHGKYRADFFLAELVQSFDPKISVRGADKHFHQIGVELASKLYPGHQAVVITHTDKKHYHNHIMVNPVHPKTGKRLDKGSFYALNIRKENDKLMRQHGIPVVERAGPKPAQIHYQAFKVLLRGATPNTLDLIKKIDVARSVSRNMNEFKDVLGVFGIKTRVTNKTITYTHPQRKKGSRGKTLGTNYKLDTIKEQLKSNEFTYSRKPMVLNNQINKIRSIQNPHQIDNGQLKFVKYVDQTGHQSILERAEFIKSIPTRALKRTILKAHSKAVNHVEPRESPNSLSQIAIEELAAKKLERETQLHNQKQKPVKSNEDSVKSDLDFYDELTTRKHKRHEKLNKEKETNQREHDDSLDLDIGL